MIQPHEALARLLQVCDGAQHIDNIGFSKFDAKYARSLIDWFDKTRFFTPPQKQALKKLLYKYRKQLSKQGIEQDAIQW
jgi:hypothetical protein